MRWHTVRIETKRGVRWAVDSACYAELECNYKNIHDIVNKCTKTFAAIMQEIIHSSHSAQFQCMFLLGYRCTLLSKSHAKH